MDDGKPLTKLTNLLEDGCLECGEVPKTIVVEGPDAVVPQPCGHVHDVKDWIDQLSDF